MFGWFGKPSKSKFARLVVRASQAAGFNGDIAFSEAEFTLKCGERMTFLGNLYDQYCAGNRAQKKQVLVNIATIITMPDHETSREQAFEQCVAVVREKALFSFLTLRGQVDKDGDKAVPNAPLSDWFVKCLVLDAPTHMRMVNHEDLKKWGVTFDELFEVGMAKLTDSTNPRFQAIGGFFVGTWKDDYDSSRVLVEDVADTLGFVGIPVFCIPNRLTLLVADSSNQGAVVRMLQFAEQVVQNEPRPCNPSPLTLGDDGPVAFQVPPESPLYQPIHRASSIAAATYYVEQKAILDEQHQQSGKDVFVATYTLTENPAGELTSYAVWTRGLPTLLPKTDIVVFVDPALAEGKQALGRLKWETVVAMVGDLMLDTEMFPPRFYVSKFPSDQQLLKLLSIRN